MYFSKLDHCIFDGPNQNSSDQYYVYSDGQVQLTCLYNQDISFNSTCSEHGKWNPNICVEKG